MEMCEVRQCLKEVVQVCSSLQLSNTQQEERKVTVKHQQTCMFCVQVAIHFKKGKAWT